MQELINRCLWLIVFGLLLSCTRESEPGTEQAGRFVKYYGGSASDIANDMVCCSDGGYALTGQLSQDNILQAFFMRTDKFGNELVYSPVMIGGGKNSSGHRLVATKDGGFLVVGSTTGSHSDKDLLIAKVNADGAVVWSEAFGGTSDDEGFSVLELSSGDLFVGGYTTSVGKGKDAWMLMLDTAGNLLWEDTFGGFGDDLCNDMVEKENYYLLIGSTASFQYATIKTSVVMVKVDKNTGSVYDFVYYGGSGDETGVKAVFDQDNNLYVLGNSVTGDSTDLYVIKLKEDFHQKLWEKYFHSTGNETGSDIVLRNNLPFITGTSEGKSDSNFLIDQLDENGNLLNTGSNAIISLGNQSGRAGKAGADGKFVIAGTNVVNGLSRITLVKGVP
jgi:hypothetical protein